MPKRIYNIGELCDTFSVEFDDYDGSYMGRPKVKLSHKGCGGGVLLMLNKGMCKKSQVIGNIYENKELMKKNA